MSIGRKDYMERKDARIDRLESHAAKAQAESAAAYNTARSIMDHIPPGQPILVGHHSEKRHCRDLNKIDRSMRKSVEADEKASYYADMTEQKIREFFRRLNNGKPLSAIELTRANVPSLTIFQQLAKHIAIQFVISEAGRKRFTDEMIAMQLYQLITEESPTSPPSPSENGPARSRLTVKYWTRSTPVWMPIWCLPRA